MVESRVPDGLADWSRRRGIHPADVLFFLLAVFGSLAVAALLARYAPLEFGAKVASVVSFMIVTAGLAFGRMIKRGLQRPDFITKHGTAVWVDGVEAINLALMDRALDRFLEVMAQEQREASPDELAKMLARTSVEWKRGRVSLIASGYELRDKAGIQHGYKIMVQWPGNIADSALYHELLHEVNQMIRLPRLKTAEERDNFHLENMRHAEASWWHLEGCLVDDF